ncbi:MAG: hypothetical protein KMY53_16020 [Desulfarculus sp.]|nr:hypothetical protein [Pseudomonadota bacterium]MBU4599254.1 hypothetical protein [Pseudomonadota bacterium]MBV1715478.1 hypothetical protein [Desulfarculus sp.]MBV1739675.1 hypothetical protein [Desulfarculus sp.]
MDKTLILDGNNMVAIANAATDLKAPDGTPTGGIIGFLRSLRAIIEDVNPVSVVAAWDGGKSRYRVAKFPAYKAHRAAERNLEQQIKYGNLIKQLPLVQEITGALGIGNVRIPGYEGDDVVAMLEARVQAKGPDQAAVIVSTDKDMLQLVSDRCWVYNPIKKSSTMVGNFHETTGVTRAQYPEFRAMVGDPSDGIPGVFGIGEGTAKKVLAEHGTFANFLTHYEDRKPKGKKLSDLYAHQEDVRTYMDLMRLPAPYDGTPAETWGPAYDLRALIDMFGRYQFRSLLGDHTQFLRPFAGLIGEQLG